MNSKQVYDHWDNTELAYEATDHTEDGDNWLNESKLESDREECDVCSKPFKSKTRLKTHMKKFHGIESILTKIENEENIEENLEELEDDKGWIGHSKKVGKKSGRQKCPIVPCSKSFKGSVKGHLNFRMAFFPKKQLKNLILICPRIQKLVKLEK